MKINPFQSLYLTDSISGDDFVHLFSPELVTMPVSSVFFAPSNVVIKGHQGAGKTMLLNLLKPEVRIAYHEKKIAFPVVSDADKGLAKFISAGINLRKSTATSFVYRINENLTQQQLENEALMFSDFCNFCLVEDLFSSIEKFFDTNNKQLLKDIGLKKNRRKLDEIAIQLSKDPCFYGYFNSVNSLSSLRNQIQEKLNVYRKSINNTAYVFEDRIINSKTHPGQPIVRLVEILKEQELIDHDTKVFIRIDQYEDLLTMNQQDDRFGKVCQSLIHQMLHTRNTIVTYRVGTRDYGWPTRPQVYRLNACLEESRDYKMFEIDKALKPHESLQKYQTFKKLVSDIFKRRVNHFGYSIPNKHLYVSWKDSDIEYIKSLCIEEKKTLESIADISLTDSQMELYRELVSLTDEYSLAEAIVICRERLTNNNLLNDLLENVFGKSPKPKRLASLLVSDKKVVRSKLIKMNDSWSEEWKEKITEIVTNDPLEGIFAEAWVKQKGENKRTYMEQWSEFKKFPWTDNTHWVGDRTHQALLIIASRNKQAPILTGADIILDASGGNIFVFLLICQHIWDVWHKTSKFSVEEDSDDLLPTIHSGLDFTVQTVGINDASRVYFDKIYEGEKGLLRQDMISFMGKYFYNTLLSDDAMSNPGHFGFSFDVDELRNIEGQVSEYLKIAENNGDLVSLLHNGKDKKKRRKYYLSPILAIAFKLPLRPRMEPKYVDQYDLINWLDKKLPIDEKNNQNQKSFKF